MKWTEETQDNILIVIVITVFVNTIGIHGIPFVRVGDACRGLNCAYKVTYATLVMFTVSY